MDRVLDLPLDLDRIKVHQLMRKDLDRDSLQCKEVQVISLLLPLIIAQCRISSSSSSSTE